MPRYFFDIRDSKGMHRDETGVELSDLETAIAEGRRALAEMGIEEMGTGADDQLELLIRDGDGEARLALSMKTERLRG
jgi:uncharacterized protein DUF6894